MSRMFLKVIENLYHRETQNGGIELNNGEFFIMDDEMKRGLINQIHDRTGESPHLQTTAEALLILSSSQFLAVSILLTIVNLRFSE